MTTPADAKVTRVSRSKTTLTHEEAGDLHRRLRHLEKIEDYRDAERAQVAAWIRSGPGAAAVARELSISRSALEQRLRAMEGRRRKGGPRASTLPAPLLPEGDEADVDERTRALAVVAATGERYLQSLQDVMDATERRAQAVVLMKRARAGRLEAVRRAAEVGITEREISERLRVSAARVNAMKHSRPKTDADLDEMLSQVEADLLRKYGSWENVPPDPYDVSAEAPRSD